jgi:hypothetical protein
MLTADVTYTKKHFLCYAKAQRKPTDLLGSLTLIVCAINSVNKLIRGTKYPILNGLIVLCALYAMIQTFRVWFILPKQCVEKQAQLVHGAMHFSFAEEGIAVCVNEADDLFRWEELRRAVYVNHCFCILLEKQGAFMIMEDELQGGTAEELTALLRQTLGKRFEKR